MMRKMCYVIIPYCIVCCSCNLEYGAPRICNEVVIARLATVLYCNSCNNTCNALQWQQSTHQTNLLGVMVNGWIDGDIDTFMNFMRHPLLS